MSNKPRESESEFLQAAMAFDDEMRCFRQAVESTVRGQLNSAKSLERAAQSLQEVAQSEERLGVALKTLSGALNRAHAQQQEQAIKAAERASAIAARTAEFQKLTEGYRMLGAAAAALNQGMATLVQKKKELGPQLPSTVFADEVQVLLDRISEVAATASEIMEAARKSDFDEVVRQVDSVRQQLLSARNKLSLFGRQILH